MTQSIPGSMRVLPDPQLTLAAVLRPFGKFEDAYNGVSGTIPIMFTEGGKILDDQAGKPGYSHRLLAGLNVSMGSRIILWLPIAPVIQPFGPYSWVAMWRMRNTYDYRTQRIGYHYPKQADGTPATGVAGDTGARVVLPCAMPTVAVTTPGPREGIVSTVTQTGVIAADYALQRLYVEAAQPHGSLYGLVPGNWTPIEAPLINAAGTRGVAQQGVMNDLGVPEDRGMPTSLLFDTVCQGDELLLACLKDQTPQDRPSWTASWSFAADSSDDATFSFLFGQGKTTPGSQALKPDIGVYVLMGVTQ